SPDACLTSRGGQCFCAAAFDGTGFAGAVDTAAAGVAPVGAAIASGDTPSGGTTTDGSILFNTSATAGVRSKSAVVPRICARFSTMLMPRDDATAWATCSVVRLICAIT